MAYLLTVVFPQDLLEKGLAANNFAMLGLGDIVIPGIFIALLLRFDVRLVFHTSQFKRVLSPKYKCAINLKFHCMKQESRMFNMIEITFETFYFSAKRKTPKPTFMPVLQPTVLVLGPPFQSCMCSNMLRYITIHFIFDAIYMFIDLQIMS